MRALLVAVGFGGLIACGPVVAGTADCGEARNTVEMIACADQELAAADAKLNEAYLKVLKRAADLNAPAPYDGKAYEAALRAAQRAWVAFRDADCKGVVPFEWGGGMGATAAVLGCLAAKTTARTKELNESYGPQ
jgi:uncharacterized protein YecT (DUF1311 family)